MDKLGKLTAKEKRLLDTQRELIYGENIKLADEYAEIKKTVKFIKENQQSSYLGRVHFLHPECIKEFNAYRDLERVLWNVRQREFLQQEIKLIDDGIAKYTIENDLMALSELTIIKEHATRELSHLCGIEFPTKWKPSNC
jgi:hypothetical protein